MTDARDLLAEIDATLKLGRERHLDFRERAFDLLVRLRPLVERECGQMRPEQHAISHDATAAVDAPSGPETSEPGSAERPGRASANAVHPPDLRAAARALIERTREGRERRTRVDAAIERGNLIAALEAALEREALAPEVTMPDHETCLAIGKVARDLMAGRIQYDGHIIEATLLWLEAEGKIRLARREEPKP